MDGHKVGCIYNQTIDCLGWQPKLWYISLTNLVISAQQDPSVFWYEVYRSAQHSQDVTNQLILTLTPSLLPWLLMSKDIFVSLIAYWQPLSSLLEFVSSYILTISFLKVSFPFHWNLIAGLISTNIQATFKPLSIKTLSLVQTSEEILSLGRDRG